MNRDIKPIVKIPNLVTKSPVSLNELLLGSSLFLGGLQLAGLKNILASSIALKIFGVSLMCNGMSSVIDYYRILSCCPIDFKESFGVDRKNLQEMPLEARTSEVCSLTERINDEYTPRGNVDLKELAKIVNNRLTDYIAHLTGQVIKSSDKVRKTSLLKLINPLALAIYIPLGGEVCLLKKSGVFDPHILAHEFLHRKGYFRELDAQVLSYFALTSSNEPLLKQSSHCERLSRQIYILKKNKETKPIAQENLSKLRQEIKVDFERHFRSTIYTRTMGTILYPISYLSMKLTGSNPRDYDENFTNFLYAVEKLRKN